MDVGLCQWWVWDVGLFDFVDLVCGFVNVVGCCRVFFFFFFFFFLRWRWWMWVCASGGCRCCW